MLQPTLILNTVIFSGQSSKDELKMFSIVGPRITGLKKQFVEKQNYIHLSTLV